MSLPTFATQTVTVQRAGLVTDHGAQVPDWTNPTVHAVTGCSVQPAGGSEDRVNRDAVTTQFTLYAPLDADVRATDRVVFDGVTFEVDGPPRRWATGVLDHIEANLRVVNG